MAVPIRFDEDWRVRCSVSEDPAAAARIVDAAEALGLRTICLYDVASRTSPWVPDFIEACRAAGRGAAVRVHCAVEGRLLDTRGTLEVPPAAAGADFVFAADHRLPTPSGPMSPETARRKIEAGELPVVKALEWLLRSVGAATLRYDRLVLADPFSILPKLGLDGSALDPAQVRWLATVMSGRRARAVMSERSQCPAPWVTAAFLAAGVSVHASTGSRSEEALGRYGWCRRAVAEIEEGEAAHAAPGLIAA